MDIMLPDLQLYSSCRPRLYLNIFSNINTTKYSTMLYILQASCNHSRHHRIGPLQLCKHKLSFIILNFGEEILRSSNLWILGWVLWMKPSEFRNSDRFSYANHDHEYSNNNEGEITDKMFLKFLLTSEHQIS